MDAETRWTRWRRRVTAMTVVFAGAALWAGIAFGGPAAGAGKDRGGERDQGSAPRDRRGQDEGFERQFHRAGDEDHRRFGPLDGSRGAGVDHEQTRQEVSCRR